MNENNNVKKLSGPELAKKQLEQALGIPYCEFEMLDLDEQHKLIEEKTGKKMTFDTRLYIDGIPMDDDHIITREQADKRINSIIRNNGISKIFRKFKKR